MKEYHLLLNKLTLVPFWPGAMICYEDAEVLNFLNEIKFNIRVDGNKPTVSPMIEYDPVKEQFDLILLCYFNKSGNSGYALIFVSNFLYKDYNILPLSTQMGIPGSIIVQSISVLVSNCAKINKVLCPALQELNSTSYLSVVAEEYAKKKRAQFFNRFPN